MVLAVFSIEIKASKTLATATALSCSAAISGNPYGVSACIAFAVATILTAFKINWSRGGGGANSGKAKRDSYVSDWFYDVADYESPAATSPLHFDNIANNTLYIMNVSDTLSLYYKRFSNGTIAQGAPLSDIDLHKLHEAAPKLKKREKIDVVWGIGADVRLDSHHITDKKLGEMGHEVKKAMGGKEGHACTTLKDNGKAFYDIKFAFYNDNYNPDGSACGA